MGDPEQGQEEHHWYDGPLNVLEQGVMPIVHTVEAGGEVAAHAAAQAFEGAGASAEDAAAMAGEEGGSLLPGIGTAIGLGQMAYHGYEAANTTGDEHWNQTGEATLGGANAAASWCPPAALYLGAGELAINGAGALSHALGGPDFNAGSVVGGVEHDVSDHPVEAGIAAATGPLAPLTYGAERAGEAAWDWLTN